MKLDQLGRFCCMAVVVMAGSCTRSIQLEPKTIAENSLQLAKAQLAAGHHDMARQMANNALLYDPTSEGAKALLEALPPPTQMPAMVPPADLQEILRRNALGMVETARALAKSGNVASAKGYLEVAQKMAPGLPEAEALARELELGPQVTAATGQAHGHGGAAAPPTPAPSGCPSVKGAEYVGGPKAHVVAAWGPPARVAPFTMADAGFTFGGLATAKEGLTQLRYEDASGITFVMVGKDDAVVAIYWDPNRSGSFASAPRISGGRFADLADASDKTWLQIPYVSNDGYATVGASAACGPGRVIMGAHCPIGEGLGSCGQGNRSGAVLTASPSLATAAA